MRSLEKHFLIGIVFSFHLSIYGQFNTLTPAIPKKTEYLIIRNDAKEIRELKLKSGKKLWKDIFNGTTKSDLKKELDSLKTLLKEKASADNKEFSRQKLRDSLMRVIQSHLSNSFQGDQKPSFVSVESEGSGYLQADNLGDESQEADFSKIAMPLNRKIFVTSPYGTRIHPILGRSGMHNGIDLQARYENVYAVLDGIITAAGWDSKGGGNYIKVKHYNRFETAYLHLSEIYYRPGEFVKAGFIIAKSGNTGNSTAAHLHFAVRENGRYIDPSRFLNDLSKANQLIVAYYNQGKNLYKQ